MPRPRRERRQRAARLEAESRGRFFLIAGVIAIVVIIAGVLAFGYWDTKIRPKGETVLQVGDKSFSLNYFERRIRYEVAEGATLSEDTDTSTLYSLLQTLVAQVETEELLRQGAQELDIAVTDQEINDEIAQQENLSSSEHTEKFLAAYRQAVRDSGLSTDDFRDLIAADLLNTKVQQAFIAEVPDTTEQVHLRQIAVSTEEEAQDVIDRLDGGEDFAALASEVSLDTSTSEQGGDLDWLPLDGLLDSVKTALSDLDVGEHSEPIAISGGFLILEPLEPPAERETTDSQKQTLGSLAQSDWLQELASRVTVVNSMNADQQTDLFEIWIKESSRFISG